MPNPTGEVYREQLAHGRVRLVKLEGQRADRAAVGAAAAVERSTVHGEQRKYFGNRVIDAFPRRRKQHCLNAVAVGLEHRKQQILLGGKEVIEAAGVGLRLLQQVGNRSGLVTLGGKELHPGKQDSLARSVVELIDHSTGKYT